VTVEYLLKKGGYNLTFQEFYQKANRIRAVQLEITNIRKKGLKLTEISEEIKYLLKALDSEKFTTENFLEGIEKVI